MLKITWELLLFKTQCSANSISNIVLRKPSSEGFFLPEEKLYDIINRYNNIRGSNMQQQILDILSEYGPKHFTKKIKNTPELYEIIEPCPGNTISEKVYNYLHPYENICKYGNNKNFNSINNGYRFCGKTSVCKCAKESVSKKCKEIKDSYSKEQKTLIHEKRVNTTMSKYGVSNNGQLSHAIETRKELYSNKEAVSKITQQVKQTKLELYGDENYNNINQIKETWKEKYTMDYWAERLDNEDYKHLYDKEYMENLIKQHDPIEISNMLNVHVQTVYRYLNTHGIRDPYKSMTEIELVGFLQSLGISNIIRNTRKLIPSGKEIDIYLPDYNLAIEYDGVYWHHEDVPHITRTYHKDKFIECQILGIQLITIFSTFWINKKDIVKQLLINKLGINTTSIFARKCIIKSLETYEIKDFLNSNHIQGYTTSSINYGLYHNDELISVMTFGKCNSRIGIGKQEDGFELIRYASSKRVVGGASKLLNHFIKEHRPNKIVSYSNNEWSDGNMYKVLGFELETEIKPSYCYISPNGSKMYHRFNYSKQKLVKKGFDKSLTEREITKQLKLLKLWDCGKKRWVLNIS